jgi:iron complex transport system ATP-binding protein
VIKAENVHVRLGKRDVLLGIDCEAAANESVAIIGPNGAGKSTLLRALARIREVDQGSVSCQVCPNPKEWARFVSFVPQSHAVVFEYSVLEFVLMAFHMVNGRWSLESKEQVADAHKALERLGVGQHASKAVTSLSSGEFQRVLMARTLAMKAPIWLLDEPTSNLDLKHQILLLELVREHVRGGGTAIAILHDLGLAARYFDRVVGLRAGAVQFDGPPADVMTEPHLSKLFDIPLKRLSDGDLVSFAACIIDPKIP